MNEREMERLLKEYGRSFGLPKPPLRSRKPFPFGRRGELSLGLGLGLIAVIGLIGVWPRRASASVVARVKQALLSVGSMEQTYDAWHGHSPPKTVMRVFYKDGLWRYDTHLGTHLERTYVFRDGQVLTNWKEFGYATLRPQAPTELRDLEGGTDSALDYVKSSTDVGATAAQRTVVVRDHAPVNGREVYDLALDRRGQFYHADIVVDKQTNLPITADTEYKDNRANVRYMHESFSFGKPLDPDLFSLETSKPLVRLPQDLDKLAASWRSPIGKVFQTDVWKVSAMPNGTIWIASTAPESLQSLALPTKLSDASGTEYLRIQDAVPSAMQSDHGIRFKSGMLYVTGFVPIKPRREAAGTLMIDFCKREPYPPGYSVSLKDVGKDTGVSLQVRPEPENGKWPSYFELMDMESFMDQVPMSEWDVRSTRLEKEGRLQEAADAYERYAQARQHWVTYSAFEPLLSEARCYRKLGQPLKAEELTKRAAELEKRLER